jgi:hypothetical protein
MLELIETVLKRALMQKTLRVAILNHRMSGMKFKENVIIMCKFTYRQ